jgi:glycosyltransferase involved in cell wall biosynthesis
MHSATVSNPRASVIVCTHNPRPAYLSAVLEALRLLALPMTDWELLIVDNGSTKPLVDWAIVILHDNEPRGSHRAAQGHARDTEQTTGAP